MKLSDMYPSKYVKGEDLQGKPWTITITRVAAENMRPNPQSPEVQKWVLYTAEGKKGIVLSRTLATQIARSLGSDDTDNWIGQRVTIYPEAMTVAGAARVAIRARAAQPQATGANGNGK